MSKRTRQQTLSEMVTLRDELHRIRDEISRVSVAYPTEAIERAKPLQQKMQQRIKRIDALSKELADLPE